MLILSSVSQGYLNKPCRIFSQSSNSPWTFFVDVVVSDSKDLRGEWLLSNEIGKLISVSNDDYVGEAEED